MFICKSCTASDLRTFSRSSSSLSFQLVAVYSRHIDIPHHGSSQNVRARQTAADSNHGYLPGKYISYYAEPILTWNSLRSSCSAVCEILLPSTSSGKLTTSRRSRSLLWHCWKCRLARDLRLPWQFTRRHHRFDIQSCTSPTCWQNVHRLT